jgi:hypothetical protein
VQKGSPFYCIKYTKHLFTLQDWTVENAKEPLLQFIVLLLVAVHCVAVVSPTYELKQHDGSLECTL